MAGKGDTDVFPALLHTAHGLIKRFDMKECQVGQNLQAYIRKINGPEKGINDRTLYVRLSDKLTVIAPLYDRDNVKKIVYLATDKVNGYYLPVSALTGNMYDQDTGKKLYELVLDHYKGKSVVPYWVKTIRQKKKEYDEKKREEWKNSHKK